MTMDLIDTKVKLLQFDGKVVYIVGDGCTGYYFVEATSEMLIKEAPVSPDKTIAYTFDFALNKQNKMQIFSHK